MVAEEKIRQLKSTVKKRLTITMALKSSNSCDMESPRLQPGKECRKSREVVFIEGHSVPAGEGIATTFGRFFGQQYPF